MHRYKLALAARIKSVPPICIELFYFVITHLDVKIYIVSIDIIYSTYQPKYYYRNNKKNEQFTQAPAS